MSSYIKSHLLEFAVWLAVVLAPIKSAMLTVSALILIDLITGILAARKRGEPITSQGFRRTICKILAYEGALVLGFAVETTLLQGSLPLVKIIGGWIGLTELKSNSENLYAITGLDIWKALLAKLAGSGSLLSPNTDTTNTPPTTPPQTPPQP